MPTISNKQPPFPRNLPFPATMSDNEADGAQQVLHHCPSPSRISARLRAALNLRPCGYSLTWRCRSSNKREQQRRPASPSTCSAGFSGSCIFSGRIALRVAFLASRAPRAGSCSVTFLCSCRSDDTRTGAKALLCPSPPVPRLHSGRAPRRRRTAAFICAV